MYDAMDLLVDMSQHMIALDEMHAHWTEQVSEEELTLTPTPTPTRTRTQTRTLALTLTQVSEEERTDAGGALVIRSGEERMAKSQSRRESAREPARHTPLHAARPPPAAPHAFRRAAAWHCTPLHAYCTACLAAPHIAPHMDPHMDPRMRATPYHSRRRHHIRFPPSPLPGVAHVGGAPREFSPLPGPSPQLSCTRWRGA